MVVTRDVPMFGFALLAQVQGTCDRIEGCGHFVRILNVWDLCSRSSFWPGHTLRQFSSGRKRVIDYVCCSRPSVSECVLIVLHAGPWIEGLGLKGIHCKTRCRVTTLRSHHCSGGLLFLCRQLNIKKRGTDGWYRSIGPVTCLKF